MNGQIKEARQKPNTLVSERLQAKMNERNMNILDLVIAFYQHGIAITPAAIYRWLNVSVDIRGSHLLALAKILRCTPEWLYGYDSLTQEDSKGGYHDG